MTTMYLRILLLTCLLFPISKTFAKLIEPDKDFHAADSLSKEAGFSLHKDTYFITGIPVNTAPSKTTSDVKYQIRFKQRLRNTPLPGGFFPYLMYTQKAFWDIYANSKPFAEINFNPGVALVRPFYLKGKTKLCYNLSGT